MDDMETKTHSAFLGNLESQMSNLEDGKRNVDIGPIGQGALFMTVKVAKANPFHPDKKLSLCCVDDECCHLKLEL